jgi:PE-PPE domain
MRVFIQSAVGAVSAVLAAVVLAVSQTTPLVVERTATRALIMGMTGDPQPDAGYVTAIDQRYIQPTNPGAHAVGLFTPEQFWPITGLFDMTVDRSVQEGVGILDGAVQDSLQDPEVDKVVVFGYSQSARIASIEKGNLAAQYADDPTAAPDIDFVVVGNGNRPDGGLSMRFEGLSVPIVGITFDGATPTDTPFDTYDPPSGCPQAATDLFIDDPLVLD